MSADAPARPEVVSVRSRREAMEALRDPALTRVPLRRPGFAPLDRHLLNSEGPDHAGRRAILADALALRTPPTVAATRAWAHTLVERLPVDGVPVDMGDAFVRPLVLAALDALLDLSSDDSDRLRRWYGYAATIDAGHPACVVPVLRAELSQLIRDRRTQPGHGLVGLLSRSCLPDDDAAADIFFTFLAGLTNTANFLGLALLALARHPREYARMRQDATVVPAAVDELLRFAEPRRVSVRVASRDTTLGSTVVPAGTRVEVDRRAASRDGSQCPWPDELRFDRPAASLAFGHGRHHCLASRLVRLVGDVTLHALRADVRSLAPVDGTPGTWDVFGGQPLLFRIELAEG